MIGDGSDNATTEELRIGDGVDVNVNRVVVRSSGYIQFGIDVNGLHDAVIPPHGNITASSISYGTSSFLRLNVSGGVSEDFAQSQAIPLLNINGLTDSTDASALFDITNSSMGGLTLYSSSISNNQLQIVLRDGRAVYTAQSETVTGYASRITRIGAENITFTVTGNGDTPGTISLVDDIAELDSNGEVFNNRSGFTIDITGNQTNLNLGGNTIHPPIVMVNTDNTLTLSADTSLTSLTNNGTVAFGSDSEDRILTVNGGVFSGTLDGINDGDGLIIASNQVMVGTSDENLDLTVNSGATMTISNNRTFDRVDISGTLNLGENNLTVTGGGQLSGTVQASAGAVLEVSGDRFEMRSGHADLDMIADTQLHLFNQSPVILDALMLSGTATVDINIAATDLVRLQPILSANSVMGLRGGIALA